MYEQVELAWPHCRRGVVRIRDYARRRQVGCLRHRAGRKFACATCALTARNGAALRDRIATVRAHVEQTAPRKLQSIQICIGPTERTKDSTNERLTMAILLCPTMIGGIHTQHQSVAMRRVQGVCTNGLRSISLAYAAMRSSRASRGRLSKTPATSCSRVGAAHSECSLPNSGHQQLPATDQEVLRAPSALAR